jgi:tetratricopeptide (TPR) repeat protein
MEVKMSCRNSAQIMGVGLLCFLFCIAFGTLKATATGDPGSYISQGKNALEKGDYKNGVQFLAKAVEESASDAEKKDYLAKTLDVIKDVTDNMFGKEEQNVDYKGILEIVNFAIGCNCFKSSELLYNQKGSVFRRQGDIEKAIAEYNNALKIDGKYTPSRFNLALCYFKQKEYKKAYDELGKIPESDSIGPTAKEKKDFLMKNFAQYIMK